MPKSFERCCSAQEGAACVAGVQGGAELAVAAVGGDGQIDQPPAVLADFVVLAAPFLLHLLEVAARLPQREAGLADHRPHDLWRRNAGDEALLDEPTMRLPLELSAPHGNEGVRGEGVTR